MARITAILDLTMPAMAPPAGVVPNFTNPPNHRAIGDTILGLIFPVMTLCVAMRIYTRARVLHQLGITDCLHYLKPSNITCQLTHARFHNDSVGGYFSYTCIRDWTEI